MTLLYMTHFVINLLMFPFPVDLMSHLEQTALATASAGRIRLGGGNSDCVMAHKA